MFWTIVILILAIMLYLSYRLEKSHPKLATIAMSIALAAAAFYILGMSITVYSPKTYRCPVCSSELQMETTT
ncbi:hypothetical protein ACTQ33_01015 [Candidatus Avoscillospira sp. LCP25S3_F1]|uniref:hypothetical protein n=1 Tax=Candidatus Avoscillospira sp. LCP25S3_F1 TaxID=3438825 RepID=UPI003F93B2FE